MRYLSLPAIAEIEQRIEIRPGKYHIRQIGDLLHPARELRESLDRIKREMGSPAFSAQYQQAPVPPGGNMIDWNWFKFFDPNNMPSFDEFVISWDTAMKDFELSNYSVGTVWGVRSGFYYLLDLSRARMDYPALRREVIRLYHKWGRPTLLIEDTGSGTSLIQDLRAQNIRAKPIRPEGREAVRMSAQSAKIEVSGEVFLPRHANWLENLRPRFSHSLSGGAHDDQVDSISQALRYMSQPRKMLRAIGVPRRCTD